MKVSNSIIYSVLLGITGISLIPDQAQAITTFAEATSSNFLNSTDVTNSTAVTFNFDSSPIGSSAITNGITDGSTPQKLSFANSGFTASLEIAQGPQFGTNAVSSPNLVAANVTPGASGTLTFTFDQPSTFFGISLGDQFDSGSTSSYTIATGSGDTILPTLTGNVGNNAVGSVSSQGRPLTVGQNGNNFFGITDATPFTSVTLSFNDILADNSVGAQKDNFTIDNIIVEGQADATAAVPFEFSPSLGLVLVGLGFGGLKYRQAKLSTKNLS